MSRHDTEDGSGGEDDDVALALGAIFTVSRESLSFPCRRIANSQESSSRPVPSSFPRNRTLLVHQPPSQRSRCTKTSRNSTSKIATTITIIIRVRVRLPVSGRGARSPSGS